MIANSPVQCEREHFRKNGRYMHRERERTHTRIAMNERENMLRQLLFFVISNRRNKLIEFQFVKLSKLIVII